MSLRSQKFSEIKFHVLLSFYLQIGIQLNIIFLVKPGFGAPVREFACCSQLRVGDELIGWSVWLVVTRTLTCWSVHN